MTVGGAVAMPDGATARLAPLVGRARGAPLLSKLIAANAVFDVVVFCVQFLTPDRYADVLSLGALMLALAVNVQLVTAALLPLRALHAAAERVAAGDLDARVRLAPFADPDIARVADTLNRLLDGVTADRARLRTLATQVITAGDAERAHVARELHDSTAQSLSALELLLAAAARDAVAVPALAERLGVMRGVAADALVEVRGLSHRVHPRVLDDLGLVAALEALARQTREAAGVDVRLSADVRTPPPAPAAATLYRVAQEALRNAFRHAAPSTVRLDLAADAGAASLTVTDDGRGFDVAAAESARRGLGLFGMRERVALVGGHLRIASQPGFGTEVHAEVPLGPSSPAELDGDTPDADRVARGMP